MRPHAPTPTSDGAPSPDDRRARFRASAARVAFGAEVLAAGVGGLAAWQARAAGEAIPRPAAVALGAGLVGLVARAVGPRLRAYVARRRARVA